MCVHEFQNNGSYFPFSKTIWLGIITLKIKPKTGNIKLAKCTCWCACQESKLKTTRNEETFFIIKIIYVVQDYFYRSIKAITANFFYKNFCAAKKAV